MMAGTPEYTVNGSPLTPEEFEVFKGRSTDRVPGRNTPFTPGDPGGFKGVLNDVNADGIQRVMDLRSGRTKSAKPPPPAAPPVTAKATQKRTKTFNAPKKGSGIVKRARASKGAIATKAKSVLNNKNTEDKLG